MNTHLADRAVLLSLAFVLALQAGLASYAVRVARDIVGQTRIELAAVAKAGR